MTVIQVHKQGQVALPEDVRTRLGLQEGDFLEIEVQDGTIVLRPQAQIDTDQAYFWLESWQAGERQAAGDIAQGRTMRFASAKEAVAHLRAWA